MKYKQLRLGDLAEFTTGKLNANKAVEDGKYPFFTTSPETLRINNFAFDQDAILLGGNNANGVFQLKRYTGKFNAYQRTYVISVVKENIINNDYLYYALMSKLVELQNKSLGTATKFITKRILENLLIKVPNNYNEMERRATYLRTIDNKIQLNKQLNANLNEMERRATYLRTIDNKIQLNKQLNANLLKLAKTKFWQIYLLPTDEFKMVPNGWEIASFSKIMTFSNGHNFKSNEMLKKYEPLTYKVFKQGNILIGGGLNELGTKSWIQKGKVTKLNKYVLKKWDLLMAMTDMKNKVTILGNTALMNCSNQYILNQRVGLIRSNNYNGTSPAYLFLLTNSKPFLHSIRSKAHSGVQVNLSSKEIRDTDVIIAPKNVNDGFNTFVKPIFDRIMVNQLENLTLNELKQTLLNRLF